MSVAPSRGENRSEAESKAREVATAASRKKKEETPVMAGGGRRSALPDEHIETEVETLNKEDKQVVSVYNGETESSTGTAEDHALLARKAVDGEDNQEHDQETEDVEIETDESDDEPGSHEVTAVVHEADQSSSAEDDSDVMQQDGNLQRAPSYDYDPDQVDSDEVVDLTLLQPDQAHAPGLTTLLSAKRPEFNGKKCLVLDLDETLVHSSFKFLRTADFVIPVEIDNQIHNVYVIKRPGVDEFLKLVGQLYEVVVFTASVSRYGDPLLDVLDQTQCIHHRLFRDSCYNYDGNYIKNLSQIGRPLSDLIILDNSPASYIFHPQHAIPISSWFSDVHDNELLDIMPLLEDLAQEQVPDVGKILDVTI